MKELPDLLSELGIASVASYISFRQRLEKSAKLSRATLQQGVQGKPSGRAIQALFLCMLHAMHQVFRS